MSLSLNFTFVFERCFLRVKNSMLFFSFTNLKILVHCFLACISDEDWFGVFFHTGFSKLWLLLSYSFYHWFCLCVSFCAWGSLSFLGLWVYGFRKIWKLGAINSSNSSLPSENSKHIRLLNACLLHSFFYTSPWIVFIAVLKFSNLPWTKLTQFPPSWSWPVRSRCYTKCREGCWTILQRMWAERGRTRSRACEEQGTCPGQETAGSGALGLGGGGLSVSGTERRKEASGVVTWARS